MMRLIGIFLICLFAGCSQFAVFTIGECRVTGGKIYLSETVYEEYREYLVCEKPLRR